MKIEKTLEGKRLAIKLDDDLIMHIKDDCIPFDPAERHRIVDPGNRFSNIGIRMVFEIASSVNYQHMLGLNVLTIRI